MNRLIKLTLLAILLLSVATAKAGPTDPPTASTAASPVYYVIMNVASRQFLYYNTIDEDRPWTTEGIKDGENFGTNLNPKKYSPNNYLWYFVADGTGYKISPKSPREASKPYIGDWDLTGTTYYIKNFNATGTTWTIEKFPNSILGVAIHGLSKGKVEPDSSKKDYYWSTKTVSGYTYIERDEQYASNPDYYTFVLYSFEDLQAEAAAQGLTATYTYDSSNPGASFKTIINAIIAKKAEADHFNNAADGLYLVRNRRYGLYLSSNGTSIKGVSTPSNFTVWKLETVGGVRFLTSNAGDGTSLRATKDGDNAVWNLTSNEAYNTTLKKSSDGDLRYISFLPKSDATNGYLGLNSDGSQNPRGSSGYGSDWELIPVSKDATTHELSYDDGQAVAIPTAINDESELLAEDEDPLKAKFFRIQNAARSVKDYSSDQTGKGGWLEDVDKTHFQYRRSETSSTAQAWVQEEAELFYTARSANFYAAVPDMTHASALWEFVLVGHGNGGNESATGLITPEHNIYVLRNVNTGKYIQKPAQGFSDGTVAGETTSKSDAATFFLTAFSDGQYALNYYTGTTSSTDQSSGALAITGTDDAYHAALTWKTTPVADSNSAWMILPAPTIYLQLLNIGTADDYDWSTLYYPFDVCIGTNPNGMNVEFFQGGWQREPTSATMGVLEMKSVVDVPANNPVIIRTNRQSGGESFGKVVFNIYPAGGMESQNPAGSFSNNVWKGIVESEGHYFGDDWRNYWVLTQNSRHQVKLLHPAGNYLLPNRAYLDAQSVQAAGIRFQSINWQFFEDYPIVPTSIQEVAKALTGDQPIYTLAGQRVSGSLNKGQLPKGIYIQGGKKILIK